MKVKELRQANVEDYLSTEEAADVLRVKPTAIRNYLHLGKFTTYKFKSLTLLDANEVERWKGRKRTK